METVLWTASGSNVLAESIDLAVMLDAHHQFAYPKEMMKGIVKALRSGGQVVLAEYRAKNPLVLSTKHHKIDVAAGQKKADGGRFNLEQYLAKVVDLNWYCWLHRDSEELILINLLIRLVLPEKTVM